MRSVAPIALCSLLSGCGVGSALALLAVAAVVFFAQLIFFSQQRCPYCKKAGVTQQLEFDGRENATSWRCDHCGKVF